MLTPSHANGIDKALAIEQSGENVGRNEEGVTKRCQLIDLSQEIFEGAPVFPGHPETTITIVDTFEGTRPRFTDGYGYTSEKIDMSTHGTTHVDSISHIDPATGAPSIDQIPLEWFYTSAICLDLSHLPPKTYYTVQMIEEALAIHGLDIPARRHSTHRLWSLRAQLGQAQLAD